MKFPILSFILAIPLSINASAQNTWSVGLRTGGELIKTTSLNEQNTNLLLQEQLFIAKKILKFFELELNGTYKAPVKNSSFASPGQINDGPDYWIETSTMHIIEFGISGRYFVYQKKGLATYVVAGINATNWTNKYKGYTSAYIGWGGSYPARYYDDKYSELTLMSKVSFGIGLNKSIADHWKVNSQFSMSYDLNAAIITDSSLGDFLPKLQLGLAYCW